MSDRSSNDIPVSTNADDNIGSDINDSINDSIDDDINDDMNGNTNADENAADNIDDNVDDNIDDNIDDDTTDDSPALAVSFDELQKLVEKEKQNTQDCQDKLKHAMADFQNMSRKTQSDIENGINAKLGEFMIEFLKIHDDFERAKQVLLEQNIDEGLDSIVKNINSLLAKYDVKPIDALGEIFDPNLHEAINIVCDPSLDDDTITKEIRKGYISHNKVIRPTLVEISKKKVN